MLQPPFENIEDLHEYVFQILLKIHEEDNSFMFTLRQPHHFISGKMKHWFYEENETSLYFSCWQNKIGAERPYLYFLVNMESGLFLCLQRTSNTLHNNIISGIYKKIVNQNPNLKDGLISIYLHKIEEIDDFKIKWDEINKIIVNMGSGNSFMIITEENEFERRLNYIQRKRRELTELNKKKQEHYIELKQEHYNIVLNHLSLQNIGHFSHLEIDISHKITCLIGENGSGKSTILKALALALTGVNPKRIDAKHKNVINLLKINGIDNETNIENYEFEGKITLNYNGNTENYIQFQFQQGDLAVKEEGDYKNIQDIYYFPQLVLGFPQLQGKTNNGSGFSLIK